MTQKEEFVTGPQKNSKKFNGGSSYPAKTQRAFVISSVISAFLASICCIGPVVFALLGISGMAFIERFEPYRPIFIVLAATLLGLGFYFAYRKKPAGECDEDAYCANPKADRVNKFVLWIAATLVAFFIFFPGIIEKISGY